MKEINSGGEIPVSQGGFRRYASEKRILFSKDHLLLENMTIVIQFKLFSGISCLLW